jgi:hypothetical protein
MQKTALLLYLFNCYTTFFQIKIKIDKHPSNLVSFFCVFNSAYQKLLRVRVCECVLLLLLLRVRTD